MNIGFKSKSILTLTAILALGIGLSACTSVESAEDISIAQKSVFTAGDWQELAYTASEELMRSDPPVSVSFIHTDYSSENSIFSKVFQQGLAEKLTKNGYKISYEKTDKIKDEVKWNVQVVPHVGRQSEVSISTFWFHNGLEVNHRNYVRYIDANDTALYTVYTKPTPSPVAPLVTKPTVGIY